MFDYLEEVQTRNRLAWLDIAGIGDGVMDHGDDVEDDAGGGDAEEDDKDP